MLSFFLFFNLKNGRQNLTIGFNFNFLSKPIKIKNENLCSVFFLFFRNVKTYVRFSFFSGHRIMKKKRKENLYLNFSFFQKK